MNFHKNSKYELLGCNWRELRVSFESVNLCTGFLFIVMFTESIFNFTKYTNNTMSSRSIVIFSLNY